MVTPYVLPISRRTAKRCCSASATSFAGKPWTGSVAPGQCVRIFTGGVMPAGTDSVVMQERASEEGGHVRIAPGALAKEGTNRRFAGEDLKAGQVVFRAGPARATRRSSA